MQRHRIGGRYGLPVGGCGQSVRLRLQLVQSGMELPGIGLEGARLFRVQRGQLRGNGIGHLRHGWQVVPDVFVEAAVAVARVAVTCVAVVRAVGVGPG